MRRARDDFPDALGPIIPSAWPRFKTKLTSSTTMRVDAGGTAVTFSTESVPCGGGNAMVLSSAGSVLEELM